MMIYSGYQPGESIWSMFHPISDKSQIDLPARSRQVPHFKDVEDLKRRIFIFHGLKVSWKVADVC